MTKSRVEAFTDGVLAIIITIMVLEVRAPEGTGFRAFAELRTPLLTYLLSFVYVGIYWSNHHHMFQVVDRIDGAVLWANLHLLFWLSLIPFTTGWMDETGFATAPVLLYGVNLLLSALAWRVLEATLTRVEGAGHLSHAIERGWKEWASLGGYLLGILGALVAPAIGVIVYALVAALWLIPDRRFEREVAAGSTTDEGGTTLPEQGRPDGDGADPSGSR